MKQATDHKQQPHNLKLTIQKKGITLNGFSPITDKDINYLHAILNDYGSFTQAEKPTLQKPAEEVSNEHPRA